eukprot:1342758-Pleurochrysis_carterae.AAC.1
MPHPILLERGTRRALSTSRPARGPSTDDYRHAAAVPPPRRCRAVSTLRATATLGSSSSMFPF